MKAVWNIAMQSGLVSHVAGWYAGYPAEELNGSFIANEFVIPSAPRAQPWPIPAGSIYPRRIESSSSELRLHPGELSGNEVLAFIPDLAEIDLQKDARLGALAEILTREIRTSGSTARAPTAKSRCCACRRAVFNGPQFQENLESHLRAGRTQAHGT